MDYQDEISKKLVQAIAISYFMRHDEAFSHMNDTITGNALWAVTDLVEDAEKLLNESWEIERKAQHGGQQL